MSGLIMRRRVPVLAAGGLNPADAGPFTYSYTGSAQTHTVPKGAKWCTATLMGAGVESAYPGGKTVLTFAVNENDALHLYVGGANSGLTGGWNGGGTSVAGNPRGGAGGTDIRLGGTALGDRIAVAGGAGGSSVSFGNPVAGGTGGGATGGTGGGTDAGKGGTQVSGGIYGGALGVGGAAATARAGGGGGYYGGGYPTGGQTAGAGGGSGYYATTVNGQATTGGSTTQGAGNTGDGQIVIEFTE